MSSGPSTLGTITTSSLSPISDTTVVMSSSTQGDSSAFTRVQSWVSPSSISLPTRTRPSRAASLRSTGMASSRLPSRMSTVGAMSGTFATIFSLEKSRKWIIREGLTGISRSGSGASMASGLKKSRGLRIGGRTLVKYGLGVVRVTVLATVAALAALLAAAPGEAATVKRTGARNWELTVPTPPSPDITVVRLTFPLGRFSAHPTRAPLRVSALSQWVDLSASAGRLFPWRRHRLNLLLVLAHRHPPGAQYPDAAGLRFAVSGARLTRRPAVDEVVGAFNRRSVQSPVAPAL